MPEFREQLDIEHPAQIRHSGGAARPTPEADHAFDGGDVIEPPAAEIILQIDELLAEFIECPVCFGRLNLR